MLNFETLPQTPPQEKGQPEPEKSEGRLTKLYQVVEDADGKFRVLLPDSAMTNEEGEWEITTAHVNRVDTEEDAKAAIAKAKETVVKDFGVPEDKIDELKYEY